MGKNNRQIGSKYEQLAADYLKKQGYCIVERNYYTPYGEIDIIAQQDEVLVFVEIKYRSNRRYGAATDAVDIANNGESVNLQCIIMPIMAMRNKDLVVLM